MTNVEWLLSGFGDEIDQNLDIQVAVLQALGAGHIEVRSAGGINVVDFDSDQLETVRTTLLRRGMGVSAIASPIGKVDIALPIEHEVARLRRVIEVAHALDSRYIRMFAARESRSPRRVTGCWRRCASSRRWPRRRA